MIGIYDSGLGGLSVMKEIVSLLGGEDYLYFADSKYCPYGTRDKEFLRERATAVTEFLTGRGAEMVVVACNTATAAAISHLRESFPIPFVGMEPAIKPAILHTYTGVIGVLATAVTFTGELYHKTLERYAAAEGEEVRVIEQVGYGLVEAVESGNIHSAETVSLLHKYIDPMLEAGADHIVLGCTHYPFLAEEMEKITAGRAAIVNPAPAVARQVQKLYGEERGTGAPWQFFSSAEFSPAAEEVVAGICNGHPYCLNNNIL
ncbi:MAG: glutamate racemase [Bacteroidales bacterium]|nr:glutamate racemase [Bacteroidales bacterium]